MGRVRGLWGRAQVLEGGGRVIGGMSGSMGGLRGYRGVWGVIEMDGRITGGGRELWGFLRRPYKV